MDIVPFIRTERLESKQVSQKIQYYSTLPVTAVFTSMNAAESVIHELKGVKPVWRIFCLGNTTRNTLVRYFDGQSIAGSAENASALAQTIIKTGASGNVVFFCGDQRRDELPTILNDHHVPVDEVIVYKTIALINKISKEYRGILFFSPSAVSAFFSANKITGHTNLFAIGQTTADEIKKYTQNSIVVSDKAGKEHLVTRVIEYYQSLKHEQIANRN